MLRTVVLLIDEVLPSELLMHLYESEHTELNLSVHQVASVSSKIINKYQCASSVGRQSHNRSSTMFDK